MAKSWSGFVPQNLSAMKEWKLLELCHKLPPDLIILPAEPDPTDTPDLEELPAEARLLGLKTKRHGH